VCRLAVAALLAFALLVASVPAGAKVQVSGIKISGKVALSTLFQLGSMAFAAHKGAHAVKNAVAPPKPQPSGAAQPAPSAAPKRP
jgi:hypothetical protein